MESGFSREFPAIPRATGITSGYSLEVTPSVSLKKSPSSPSFHTDAGNRNLGQEIHCPDWGLGNPKLDSWHSVK